MPKKSEMNEAASFSLPIIRNDLQELSLQMAPNGSSAWMLKEFLQPGQCSMRLIDDTEALAIFCQISQQNRRR